MNSWKVGLLSVALGCLVVGTTSSAFGQAPPDQGGKSGRTRGGGGPPGGTSGRGGYDPASSKQRSLDRIREQLASPDDEWRVLAPRIEKALDAQKESHISSYGFSSNRSSRSSRGGDPNRGGGPPADPSSVAAAAAANASAVQKAEADVKAALDDKSTPPEIFTQRLATLRQVREKARVNYAVAQKELRELVTQRQEAVLVANGLLE